MKTRLFSQLSLRIAAIGLLCSLWLGFTPNLKGLNGVEGTFEFACDAPWRIEPHTNATGAIVYGAIPIQVSIHDARETGDDNLMYHKLPSNSMITVEPVVLPKSILSLGKFLTLRVRQLNPPTSTGDAFYLNDFHEIEMTVGAWPSDATHSAPVYKLCRRWAGENPEPFRDLSNTSEWHGSVWYQPRNATPGSTVVLEIEVVLERDAWSDDQIKGALSGQKVAIDLSSRLITLRNYVQVHFGEAPLPRFDSRWIYGDLHYHSQGTDNEGESGYNYRGVVRAMGAMGLDFLFATDHASNSEQLMDLDLHIDLMEELFGRIGGDVDQLEEEDADETWKVLRDMDARRYRFSYDLIYGLRGVNREAAYLGANRTLPNNYQSYGVVPQLFLGGEVDAIPEVKLSTAGAPPPPLPTNVPSPNSFSEYAKYLAAVSLYKSWKPAPIQYGNGLSYDVSKLRTPGNQPMAIMYEAAGDAMLIHDFQGLDTYDLYGREHLVYFPSSSKLDVRTGGTTFIPSFTSRFGGATRRLDAWHKGKAPLLPEIEQKGFAFVAHHLNAGSGGRGPEGAPWTMDHMLLKAFKSRAILGLEFWNEDSRFTTRICSHGFCKDDGFLGSELGYERNEYFSLFGYQPGELTDVALALPEVREGFITGRFAGSQFELKPFSLPDGRWEQATTATEHELHHGAYDWDRMNLMGLDFENQAKLPWLTNGEPRRVLMSGGSDAHGDLNYRREGYFLGAEDATDTAIGKPRNLVFAGRPEIPPTINTNVLNQVQTTVTTTTASTNPKILNPGSVAQTTTITPTSIAVDPSKLGTLDTKSTNAVVQTHTQEQVIRAIKEGHYCITDGPAIRIAIDTNGNNIIDDSDIQMGDVYRFQKNLVGRQTVTLLVECQSTPEFGPVQKVDLYVGVQPGLGKPNGESRVYAPANHAVRDPARAPGSSASTAYISQGRFYAKMEDGYWQAPELTLKPTPGTGFKFTKAFVLDLNRFEVSKGYSADRFFVRAFAQTTSNMAQQKPSRYAFTNPIWLLRNLQLNGNLPVVQGGISIAPPPELPAVTVERDNLGQVKLEFLGILQSASDANGPFEDVEGAVSPYMVLPRDAGRFFRARD